jgi:hypothetical protein
MQAAWRAWSSHQQQDVTGEPLAWSNMMMAFSPTRPPFADKQQPPTSKMPYKMEPVLHSMEIPALPQEATTKQPFCRVNNPQPNPHFLGALAEPHTHSSPSTEEMPPFSTPALKSARWCHDSRSWWCHNTPPATNRSFPLQYEPPFCKERPKQPRHFATTFARVPNNARKGEAKAMHKQKPTYFEYFETSRTKV